MNGINGMNDTSGEKFAAFCRVMETLLGEGGCPWDRAQTHESLRPYLLEECYEAVDAIDQGDRASLCEELGDVLMEVVFHAKLAERDGTFTMDDIIDGISDKIIRRHSHIFGEDQAQTAEEVEAFWAANKRKEKPHQSAADRLRAIPKALPALIRAEKVLASAAQIANESIATEPIATEPITTAATAETSATDCIEKARQFLTQLERALAFSPKPSLEHTPERAIERTDEQTAVTTGELFGKLLFTLVRLAAIFEINPEFSLTNQVEAFINTNSIECK